MSQIKGSLVDQQWFSSVGHVQGVGSGRDRLEIFLCVFSLYYVHSFAKQRYNVALFEPARKIKIEYLLIIWSNYANSQKKKSKSKVKILISLMK